MGETSDRSFTPEELAKQKGESPGQRVEAVVRRSASILPLASAAALALLFALGGVDFGQIAGAFLLINSARIFSLIGRFAPKRS